MSDFNNNVKEILKPLFGALILIAFVFIFSSNKSDTILDLAIANVANPQNIFASLSQKLQPELPDLILEQNNYFRATCPPFTVTPKVLGALFEGFNIEDIQRTIIEHIVEQGDSLWSIAAKFDVSVKSILWANDMGKTTIQPGQKLIIPPVSGIIHHVKSGDTVSGIAKKYKTEAEEIFTFNQLSGEADIFIGDILIVPGGEMPSVTVSKPSSTWAPLANSYFICPIAPPCRITQGLHWYNAIDFSHGKCGEPIYAAAGGTVLKVKLTNSTSRWAFGGAGNNLTILHPNGVVTMYGHILSSFVNPGDYIYQGQMIALMGGQPGTPGAGMSTGCHLHFGVSGARNPFR